MLRLLKKHIDQQPADADRRPPWMVGALAAALLLTASSALAQDVNDERGDTQLPPEVLAAMLEAWGPCPEGPCPADLNGDRVVDNADIALALGGEAIVPIDELTPLLAKDMAEYWTCPMEPMPGVQIWRAKSAQGGGLAADWDGAGQGSVTLFWHMENTTGDLEGGQRQALIDAMQAWADVAAITFREVPTPNRNTSVDWAYATGDHSTLEPAEAGDADCPFNGAGGVLAHAGFPPGVNSTCINPMAETFAGNVHFDEAETWEQDSEGAAGAFSLTLIACHEVGHSIGLTHDTSGGGDVMRPSFSDTSTFNGLTADDIANLQAGYSSTPGSVITLNQDGVWVDGGFGGTEWGTSANPFDTVGEGVNGVPPFSTNVVVHIDAGTYNQAITITESMILQAENGTVIIE